MHTTRTLALAAGAALLLSAVPAERAAAQTFPTLAPGQTVQGRLEAGDPTLSMRGRFRVWRVQAQPGRRYVARLDSEDFDAFLSVARTVGGLTDYMRHDDDGGEGTNARLRFTVPAAGTYLIVAQALHEDATGAFTLALDTVPHRPAPVRDVALGETVRGTLAETDAEYEDGDGFYHLFRFQGAEGQRVRVRMNADDFPAMMEIGMMDGDAFIPLEEEGFGFGEFTAATLPSAGTYHVRAGGFGTGDYTLTVEERIVRPLQARPIRRGEEVRGTLGDGDGELEDGRWADAYSFTGRAGERVTVRLASDDFDAYLFLGRNEGGAFQELASDDDSDGDLNSRIEFTLPADGEYVIHATGFGPGAEGAYILRLEP